MKPDAGMVLRVLGPLVEVVCIITLLRIRGRSVTILGVSVEQVCYLGVIAGLTMVVAGLFLSQFRRERNKRRL